MNIRKEILNSDGQQFYQAQLSLTSSYSTQEKGITTYGCLKCKFWLVRLS